MDSSEFKNYFLGLIFFKYLSSTLEEFANGVLEENEYEISYSELEEDHEIFDELLQELTEKLGYFIKPKYLFKTFIEKISRSESIIEDLSTAFISIEKSAEGTNSQNDFEGLFNDVDLNNNKLGNSTVEKNKLLSSILNHIDEIEGLTEDTDKIGKAYEYAIKQFASESGKKGGEFYTPKEVSDLIANLVSIDKKEIKSIYDPSCGSGSLLINTSKKFDKFERIKGQELNTTTYNIARMNMFLHGIGFKKFDLKQGDTLKSDKFKEEKFDVIVANPPFGVKWDPAPNLLDEDERFIKYGKLAPKSKGEFAFLQHMLYHLKDSGIMASVAPHGVLFRGAAELTIRKYMIEKDKVLDAVIGLPANLFYGTSIPAIILIFKKHRTNEDILFIDASKEFEKQKNQNILNENNIQKIKDTYEKREDIDKYSRKVLISEIEENEYNLNIPRYIDTFEEEEPVDIDEVNKTLKELQEQQTLKQQEFNKMLEELEL